MSYEKEFDFCKDIAKKCGDVALTFYNRCGGAAAFQGCNIDTKAHINDLVTDGDKAVENFFIENAKKQYPNYKILGEESTSSMSEKNVPEAPKNLSDLNQPIWVVDPIDGTTNFVHGFEHWCISIGFIADGSIKFGVIYQPTTGQMYSAYEGQGAFCNGKKITCSGQTSLQNSLFSCTLNKRTNSQIREFLEKGYLQGVRNTSSAALMMCEVASGQTDLYLHEGISAWDYCAGIVICKEAGCVVKDTNLVDEVDVFGRKIAVCSSKEQLNELISSKIKTHRIGVASEKDELRFQRNRLTFV